MIYVDKFNLLMIYLVQWNNILGDFRTVNFNIKLQLAITLECTLHLLSMAVPFNLINYATRVLLYV